MVVIGGGDTAMDCVRTAVRQGAAKVTCLYRRDRANMPGSQREVANAEEEGVEFAWLTAPRAFTGDATVTGVRVARMRLGAPDATGRQSPEEIPDADYTEPAELVIKALGFEPEELPRPPSAGTINISWQANWDRDNSRLSYRLYRDGTVISTRTVSSRFWYRPTMQQLDSVPPGSTHEYKVVVNDTFGNTRTSTTVSLKAK